MSSPSTGPKFHPYTPVAWRSGAPPPADSPAHAALKPAVALMEDLRLFRVSEMRAHVLPEGQGVNLRPNAPDGLIHASLSGLMDRVEEAVRTGGAFCEPLYDVEVWVHGDVGVAWTPYDVWRRAPGDGNGERPIGEGEGDGEENLVMSHVGSDIIMLARVAVPGEEEKQWKISLIADNARPPSSFPSGGKPTRYAGPASQDPVEEAAVLAVVQQIFDCFKSGKLEVLYEIMLPGIKFNLYRGDTVRFTTVEEFIERVTPIVTGHEVVEVLEDPVVRIDHDVAMVWGEFKCFIDGKLDHWGVDIVSLAKRGGRWVITGLGDDDHRVA